MKILAIEASSLVASGAILQDDIITAEYTINHKVTHSQTLLPMIDEICKRTDTRPEEFDAIAVAAGPGSFTGLRIGCATAKGLGLALDIPIIHVPTLEAMAYNMYGSSFVVCPIMDARRSQVYTGAFEYADGEILPIIEDCAIGIDELVSKLNGLGRRVFFIGDGIPVNADYIRENAFFEYEFAPAHLNRQRAGSVAALGARMFLKGKIETAAEHLPDYFRVSQAERELKEKQEKNEQ